MSQEHGERNTPDAESDKAEIRETLLNLNGKLNDYKAQAKADQIRWIKAEAEVRTLKKTILKHLASIAVLERDWSAAESRANLATADLHRFLEEEREAALAMKRARVRADVYVIALVLLFFLAGIFVGIMTGGFSPLPLLPNF